MHQDHPQRNLAIAELLPGKTCCPPRVEVAEKFMQEKRFRLLFYNAP